MSERGRGVSRTDPSFRLISGFENQIKFVSVKHHRDPRGDHLMSKETRKVEIRSKIRDLQNELNRLDDLPDGDFMANGTLVHLTISFSPDAKRYEYVLFKINNCWYSTGQTGSPGGSWSTVLNWMKANNLQVWKTRVGLTSDLKEVEVPW